MPTARSRFRLGFWLVAALAQLAGDAALLVSARTVRDSVPWLDLSVTHLTPDSLHRATIRYLRDSLGVTTARHNDTLVITVPPAARQSVTARMEGVSQIARDASPWLVAALVLLHLPLLLAILVTIISFRDRAREEENLALEEWRDSA